MKKYSPLLLLSATALVAHAQEPAIADSPATEVPAVEEAPAVPPADNATGFSPETMQEWQAIEKELNTVGDDPEKLLAAINTWLTRDISEETRTLMHAIKAHLIGSMIDKIFMTAETEADILRAKALVTEMVSVIPDEEERKAALEAVEAQFANPTAMLQEIQQARAEQEAADLAADAQQDEEAATPELTEQDYDRIAVIRMDLEGIADPDLQLEFLNALLPSESPGVQSWIRPHMTQMLIDEYNKTLAAGVNTTDDVLKIKAIFVKIVKYCYPEEEKQAALEDLELRFADPEAVLHNIREQQELMGTPAQEDEEEEAQEPQESEDPVVA